MTHYFYANDMINCKRELWHYYLNNEVVLWLSKNLRKRPTDNRRRYDYMKSYLPIAGRSLHQKQRRKAYNIGVIIYNEEDAMAFKLRWL